MYTESAKKSLTTKAREFAENRQRFFLCGLCALCGEASLPATCAALTLLCTDGTMLACGTPSGPKWRNWQTRYIQGVVPVRAWRFESSLRHIPRGVHSLTP